MLTQSVPKRALLWQDQFASDAVNKNMDKCKPTAGFWCTVILVAAFALYPISFGPVMWMHCRTLSGGKAIRVAYAPVIWLYYNTSAAPAIEWWVLLGAKPGSGNPWPYEGDIIWLQE